MLYSAVYTHKENRNTKAAVIGVYILQPKWEICHFWKCLIILVLSGCVCFDRSILKMSNIFSHYVYPQMIEFCEHSFPLLTDFSQDGKYGYGTRIHASCVNSSSP